MDKQVRLAWRRFSETGAPDDESAYIAAELRAGTPLTLIQRSLPRVWSIVKNRPINTTSHLLAVLSDEIDGRGFEEAHQQSLLINPNTSDQYFRHVWDHIDTETLIIYDSYLHQDLIEIIRYDTVSRNEEDQTWTQELREIIARENA